MKKKNFKNHKKREGRKALSPIISTIILIMIVIIIAIIIILWFTLFIKEVVLKEVGGNSKRAEDFCNDLQLNAINNPDGSFGVTNEGNVPVYGFELKTSDSEGNSNTRDIAIATNPGNSISIMKEDGSGPMLSTDYTEVKLIPMLLGKKKGGLTETVTCAENYAVIIK